MAFHTKSMPKRVFKGIFEITGYIRELLGDETDFSDIPDTINLKAVLVEMKDCGCAYSVCADAEKGVPVFLQVLVKTNSVISGILRCGDDYTVPVKSRSFFDMEIDLFRDVRRIEEYVDTVDVGETQVVIVAHLENKGIRISILKEGKINELPADAAIERMKAGLTNLTKMVADLTGKDSNQVEPIPESGVEPEAEAESEENNREEDDPDIDMESENDDG